MTIRAICFSLAALSLACGPGEVADDADDGTTGTNDASSTSGPRDSDDVTSSVDTVGDVESTSDASTEAGEATSGDSTETGAMVPGNSRYELVGLAAVLEPEGCAATRGGQPSAWSVEFTLPAADGEFAMIETFGPYVSELACTLDGDALACARETDVDYARFSGMDASVHHVSAYEASWDGDALVGTYTAEFECEGEDCSSILEEWQLVAFPCAVQVPFTGVLAQGQ